MLYMIRWAKTCIKSMSTVCVPYVLTNLMLLCDLNIFEMVTDNSFLHNNTKFEKHCTKILLLSCRRMHAIKLPTYYVGEESNE